ncbi:MAG: HlyD family efflux transporter periplasmic adaptor subunit, partial [Oscillospiraceae bacterium]|nr:HlyD family efflux transporter periplasmic adaptor subunit [Oscillospiraceae bacterium]
SYTTQIQSLQTDIDRTKYDIKVKKINLEKIENSIKNASVKADTDGTVKGLKTPEEMQENGTDVIMTIVSSGDFRIKGKINEQNMGSIMQGSSVIISSRVDDTITWKGMVSEIGNEPEVDNNNMYFDGSDTETKSSNYAFYIEPESTEGLMLGQHVLIEIDYGQSDAIEKDGIWLYNDYVVDIDGDKPYVWAADKDGRLEKRFVEIGQKDEMNGDSEIISGLKDSDLIAYPADDYQEGMKTSTDIDDIEQDDKIDDGDVPIDDIPVDDILDDDIMNDVDFIPEGADIDNPEDGIDADFADKPVDDEMAVAP